MPVVGGTYCSKCKFTVLKSTAVVHFATGPGNDQQDTRLSLFALFCCFLFIPRWESIRERMSQAELQASFFLSLLFGQPFFFFPCCTATMAGTCALDHQFGRGGCTSSDEHLFFPGALPRPQFSPMAPMGTKKKEGVPRHFFGFLGCG